MTEVTAAELKSFPSWYTSSRGLFDVLVGEDTAAPLIEASLAGEIAKLRSMLTQSPWIEAALESPPCIYAQDRIRNHEGDVRGVLAIQMSNIGRVIRKAAESGQAKAVSTLLDFASHQGLDPSSLIGRYTVRTMIESGHVAVLEAFAAAYPTITTFDLGHGRRPLDLAVARCQLGIAEVLLRLGVGPGVQEPLYKPTPGDRSSLLSRASRSPMGYRMTELLLQYGISAAGSGALHVAAEQGSLDLIHLLTWYGADVNERFPETTVPHRTRIVRTGWTPMHTAASAGQFSAFELLKEKGANADLENLDGETPVQLLQEENIRD